MGHQQVSRAFPWKPGLSRTLQDHLYSRVQMFLHTSIIILVSCVSTLTADASLVLLSDLQQLHACSLDGVEDLQGGRRTHSMTPKHSSRFADSRETVCSRTRSSPTQKGPFFCLLVKQHQRGTLRLFPVQQLQIEAPWLTCIRGFWPNEISLHHREAEKCGSEA